MALAKRSDEALDQDLSDWSSLLAAVEIAQVARHELRNLLDTASMQLGRLERHVDEGGQPFLRALDETLGSFEYQIDRFSLLSDPIGQEVRHVLVHDAWREALSHTDSQLQRYKITTAWAGPTDFAVSAPGSSVTHIFLNVVLNAIQALSSVRQLRDRRITAHANTSKKGDRVVVTVVDNGPGIRIDRLRGLHDGQSLDPPTAIFQPGVSLRQGGTGWGLAIVRRLLRDIGGDARVVEYRHGFALGIEMPLASDGRSS